MKLKILGCSGGIGDKLRTTSMLIDHDVLIDAGTGVCDLGLDEMSLIDHVFLTHSHLDHVVSIPFMLDSVACMRERPLTVYATEETLEALKQHIFNWKIWPDFNQIPNPRQPYMRYQPIAQGETVVLNGRAITAMPANHVISALGFHLDSGNASLVFTGDTTTQDTFWELVNKIDNLKYLIIETAFPNIDKDLAQMSGHLCPSLLAEELEKLQRKAIIYISHMKPGASEITMREIGECVRSFSPRLLSNGQVFEF